MRVVGLVVLLIISGCRPVAPSGFLPPEDQWADASETEAVTPVTREIFDSAIKLIRNTYSPDVAALGGTLDVVPAWDSDEVGARSAQSGTRYKTWVHGGLARRPEMTDDALILILCHEMGHFFGGAPLGGNGLAAEGQADFFALNVCLKRLWATGDNSPAVSSDSDPELDTTSIAACEAQSVADTGWLCRRSLRAAWAAMHMAAARRDLEAPAFATPDVSVALQTLLGYPPHQCRLDTMAAGALNAERPGCWFKAD